MKVTAIIADELINEVKHYSNSTTTTEAITIALRDWLDIHHIKELNAQISKNPLTFNNSAKKIREVNRKS